MRLFIGIELSPEVRHAVAGAAEACRKRVARAAPRASVRWVEPGNLHVTLWFLGEVAEANAMPLQEVLAEPFRTPAFRISLQGFGTYPPTGSPRVIWIGLGDGREPLVEVHRELGERLPALGFEPEKRAYSPHLTLARVKEIRSADAIALRSALGKARALGSFDAPFVTLFRSRLSPKGSQYESLLRVPLK